MFLKLVKYIIFHVLSAIANHEEMSWSLENRYNRIAVFHCTIIITTHIFDNIPLYQSQINSFVNQYVYYHHKPYLFLVHINYLIVKSTKLNGFNKMLASNTVHIR